MNQRVLSGIQPTGSIHLGNYLGAIKNWVAFQKDHDSLFCIVNLHALTTGFGSPAQLREHVRLTAACYIACGIDPNTSAIFAQSQVTGHSELAWLLGCLTPLGWLNRMTQFKDKAGKHKEQASLGLYGYPVLMAADILLYKATHVPVGADQKQHLELARDIAGAFNAQVGKDYFPLPEPCIMGTSTRVMSLRDGTQKMSKSDPSEASRIHMTDDADTIAQKIRKAKTDSALIPATWDELEGRPEAQNLVQMLSTLENQTPQQILNTYAGQNFAPFKARLIEVLQETLNPISGKIHELMTQDQAFLETCLAQGAEKARTLATKHMHEIHGLIGL